MRKICTQYVSLLILHAPFIPMFLTALAGGAAGIGLYCNGTAGKQYLGGRNSPPHDAHVASFTISSLLRFEAHIFLSYQICSISVCGYSIPSEYALIFIRR